MNKIVVGISDQKLCKSPDVLVTYALGSCVGICMIDKVLGIAGLAHIMLPDSGAIPNDKNKFKFADTGRSIRLSENLFVQPDPQLLHKLEQFLGENNVKLV